MKTQEAQKLFYDLYDQWKAYHDAAQDLRIKVTKAFVDVSQGSSKNPSLGIIAMLESMEAAEKRLQAKMDEVINSIRD